MRALKFRDMIKMNFHRRVSLLVLSGSVLTFLVLSLSILIGMSAMRDRVMEIGGELSHAVSDFTEEVTVSQAKKRVTELAIVRAERIESEIQDTADSVKRLSGTMTAIMRAPELYRPYALPDPHTETVMSGTAYLNYSDRLAQGGIGDELRAEMGLASHFAAELVPLGEYYTACFAGSRNGYLVAVDVRRDGGPIKFTRKFLEEYDPREMGWYKLGAVNDKPAFTGIYVDTNGNRCITCVMPYYDADGFAGVVGIDCNPEMIYRQAIDVAKGSGDSFVLGPTGEVLFSTRRTGILAPDKEARDIRKSDEQSLAFEATCMVVGKEDVQLVTVDGVEYYLAYAPMRSLGWSFGTLVEKENIIYPAQYARDRLLVYMKDFSAAMEGLFLKRAQWVVPFLVLVLAVLFIASIKASNRFVQPILRLADGVNEIAQGNLDKKLDIRTGDEIEHLAHCVNNMTDELKKYIEGLSKITAEKERIATELSVAANIQAGMLPRLDPEFADNEAFELYATMQPAKEVGGDFYDFYMLDEDRLAVTIADVSGKGVPAALFMVRAETVLKNLAMTAGLSELSEVMGRMNRQLCENNEDMMFVTVFFGVLNIRTGVFDYVNAGHNPPLVRHDAEGGFQYLLWKKKSRTVGVFESASYEAERLTMAPGDMMFLYTDGVTEAIDESGRLYSEERLRETLDRVDGNDIAVKDILASVREDIDAYAGQAEQADDITMMGIRYKGA